MSGQNSLDFEKYGVESVDTKYRVIRGYSHELRFKESIDWEKITEIAKEMGLSPEINSVENGRGGLLGIKDTWIKRKLHKGKYIARIDEVTIDYDDPARKLVFRYGEEMLGWDKNDADLRSIVGCD